MAEAFKACRTASQSISVASNGGRGSQEAADACSPRRRAIRRRHSAVDEGRGGRVVARHIYQHFQDHEKIYETDPQVTPEHIDNTLYHEINNDIEYGLFENVIDSYYHDSQIRDDFQCIKTCHTHDTTASMPHSNPSCTHTYDHISQLDSLADTEQQQTLYNNEMDASLFTTDTSTPCTFNINPSDLETEFQNDVHIYVNLTTCT